MVSAASHQQSEAGSQHPGLLPVEAFLAQRSVGRSADGRRFYWPLEAPELQIEAAAVRFDPVIAARTLHLALQREAEELNLGGSVRAAGYIFDELQQKAPATLAAGYVRSWEILRTRHPEAFPPGLLLEMAHISDSLEQHYRPVGPSDPIAHFVRSARALELAVRTGSGISSAEAALLSTQAPLRMRAHQEAGADIALMRSQSNGARPHFQGVER